MQDLARTAAMVREFFVVNPWRMVAMLACLLLAGLAEGVGFITLLPVLGIATGEGLSRDSALGAWLGDLFETLGFVPPLWLLLSVVVGGVLTKAGLTLLAVRNVGYAAADFATELRLALIQKLMAARWQHFVSQATGRITNAIGVEAGQAAAGYSSLANLLATGIQVGVFSLLALLASWQVTVMGLLAGFLMIFLLQRLVGMARQAGRAQGRVMSALVGRLADGLQLIKPLKAMGQEDTLHPLLEAEARDINAAQRRLTFSMAGLSAFQEPVFTVFLAVGVYVALTHTAYALADLLFMAILFQRIVVRTGGLQVQYQKMTSFESAYWSIRNAIDRAADAAEPLYGGAAPPALVEGLRLEHVSFGYDGVPVLRDVTIAVPARQLTAIIGPSGAGKTTLVDLLIGLLVPDAGEITIDGLPLREIDARAWRKSIGYVPQDLMLLHDTIAGNVTLGDASVSRADVEAALRAAGAWDFVQSLREGLDTVVGERGARLSGGQRQRIAIARALARRPRLLILDEPTTALDPETERAICVSLHDLTREITILAISHQTAIVDAADVVYRILGGKVVAAEDMRRVPADALRASAEHEG